LQRFQQQQQQQPLYVGANSIEAAGMGYMNGSPSGQPNQSQQYQQLQQQQYQQQQQQQHFQPGSYQHPMPSYVRFGSYPSISGSAQQLPPQSQQQPLPENFPHLMQNEQKLRQQSDHNGPNEQNHQDNGSNNGGNNGGGQRLHRQVQPHQVPAMARPQHPFNGQVNGYGRNDTIYQQNDQYRR
jgi:hypothetical protein